MAQLLLASHIYDTVFGPMSVVEASQKALEHFNPTFGQPSHHYRPAKFPLPLTKNLLVNHWTLVAKKYNYSIQNSNLSLMQALKFLSHQIADLPLSYKSSRLFAEVQRERDPDVI